MLEPKSATIVSIYSCPSILMIYIDYKRFTRSGTELKLIDELYDLFPGAFIDGETW